jgi:hypothetical protein
MTPDRAAEGGERSDATAARGPVTLLELEWLPGNDGIAVNGRWVLHPDRNRYEALSCAAPTDAGQTGCGTQALAGLAIPVWLDRRATAARTDDVINTSFWLSAQSVFVQQFDRRAEVTPACRICTLDRGSARSGDPAVCRWRRPPGGCLDPELSYLTRVDRGPRNLLALHAEAEGHFALSIVRYDPSKGQTSVGIPAISLEGASLINVRFAPDGSAVDLISPCELRPAAGGRAPACDDVEAQPRWRLYSRPVGPGALSLRRADLPPGAVMHPKEEIFAWPRGASVCVGDPGSRSPACFPLPETDRR